MRDAISINDFCEAFSISRSAFYELKNNGQAPRTMKLGKTVRISKQAINDWVREMESSAEKTDQDSQPNPASSSLCLQ